MSYNYQRWRRRQAKMKDAFSSGLLLVSTEVTLWRQLVFLGFTVQQIEV